jgi:hypothetical protein
VIYKLPLIYLIATEMSRKEMSLSMLWGGLSFAIYALGAFFRTLDASPPDAQLQPPRWLLLLSLCAVLPTLLCCLVLFAIRPDYMSQLFLGTHQGGANVPGMSIPLGWLFLLIGGLPLGILLVQGVLLLLLTGRLSRKPGWINVWGFSQRCGFI